MNAEFRQHYVGMWGRLIGMAVIWHKSKPKKTNALVTITQVQPLGLSDRADNNNGTSNALFVKSNYMRK